MLRFDLNKFHRRQHLEFGACPHRVGYTPPAGLDDQTLAAYAGNRQWTHNFYKIIRVLRGGCHAEVMPW